MNLAQASQALRLLFLPSILDLEPGTIKLLSIDAGLGWNNQLLWCRVLSSGLRLRKIAASIDCDDKEKKNFSGIHSRFYFLYIWLGSVYFNQPHPPVNPALVCLALALEYLVGTCTPGSGIPVTTLLTWARASQARLVSNLLCIFNFMAKQSRNHTLPCSWSHYYSFIQGTFNRTNWVDQDLNLGSKCIALHGIQGLIMGIIIVKLLSLDDLIGNYQIVQHWCRARLKQPAILVPGPILGPRLKSHARAYIKWFTLLWKGVQWPGVWNSNLSPVQICPRFKSQTWGRLEAWWLRYLEAPGSNTEQVTCGQLIIL